MAEAASSLRHNAEHLAANLPPLLVAARRVAATVAQGVHGRRRVGQGETFWQFRPYEIGDPPQLLDWRPSAKTDRVFVRELEWEAAQSVWIWRDLSGSMAWRSSAELPLKRERADLLSLALAVLLIGAGEHVALLGSALRPVTGRAGLSRLTLVIERESEGSDDGPPSLPLPRNAHVVLIGDLLTPLDPLDRVVRDYAARGIKGHMLQVLDPAEEDLPYEGRVRFEDLEDDSRWLLPRVEAARSTYRQRFEEHCDGLATIARSVDWSYSRHRTDRPPQAALMALYTALSQGGEL